MRKREKKIINNIDDVITTPDLIDWYEVCRYQLSDEFIIKYAKYIEWYPLSVSNKFSKEIIEKFHDKIMWIEYIQQEDMTLEELFKYKEYLDWNVMVYRKDLTEELIEENIKFLNSDAWDYISMSRVDLPITFFIKHKDKIKWKTFIFGHNAKRMTFDLYKEIKDVLDIETIKLINKCYIFENDENNV